MYLPRYHLYPTNAQILHHLVLELFVLAPQHAQESDSFFSLVPSGPMFKYWWILAAHRKQIFQSHPLYTELVLISISDLPEDVLCIGIQDTILHSYFGTILLDPKRYVESTIIDDEIFSNHALWIESQIPFIRWYKHVDSVVPYIVNISLEQHIVHNTLNTIMEHHGDDACYVFIKSDMWIEKIMSYIGSDNESSIAL